VPFADLETMSLPDYIAQEAAKDSFWFFLHIPKTAGSSFSTELAAKLQPYYNIHVDHADTTRSYHDKIADAANGFVEAHKATPFGSASGHLLWWHLDPIRAAIPDMRFVSILRDPVARVVSEFRYQRTPVHPLYKEFIETYPTLESYASSAGAQDVISNFLYGRRPVPTKDQLIEHLRTKFAFVGLLEMYPISFTSIFACMGHPGLRPTEHQRKTTEANDNSVTMTPQLREMIKEANPLDQAAYDHVRTVLIRHRDANRVKR
jgi:hypothetical protein